MGKPLIALFSSIDTDIYCFRKELIEAIVASGYDVLISCPYGPKLDLMGDIPYIYDNPDIDRRGTNPLKDLSLIRHYYRLLKRYRPAVVLTYAAKPNVYVGLIAHRLHIPVINNLTGLGSVVNETGMRRKFIIRLFKMAYRKSSCMMFQNSTNMVVAKELGMVRGKYRLIPGSGVNTRRYPLQEYPDGGDGKTGAKIVFNYIGRVLHDKGVDDYIAAAKRIKSEFPATEFNMLGFIEPTEMHYKAELEELEKQGIIRYHGNQDDLKPWIGRAHATIHPSTYGEGMSNVLLESASSGRFLITTDNPGCRETVEQEKTGYIYEGGNTEALVGAIKRFLALPNDVRREMGEAGRRRVESLFSREIVIKVYLEEISKLLKD